MVGEYLLNRGYLKCDSTGRWAVGMQTGYKVLRRERQRDREEAHSYEAGKQREEAIARAQLAYIYFLYFRAPACGMAQLVVGMCLPTSVNAV